MCDNHVSEWDWSRPTDPSKILQHNWGEKEIEVHWPCVRFGHRGTSVHDHIQRSDIKLKNCPTRFQFRIRRHKKVKVKVHRDRVDMSYQSFLKHQNLSPPLKGVNVGRRIEGLGSNQVALIDVWIWWLAMQDQILYENQRRLPWISSESKDIPDRTFRQYERRDEHTSTRLWWSRVNAWCDIRSEPLQCKWLKKVLYQS